MMIFKKITRIIGLFPAIAFMILWASMVLAADYPNRPITLIVPYAAGGGTDTQARIAGAALERLLGNPLMIVNKTGGNGIIGFAEAAMARPNGYTLGYLAYPDVVVPPQYKKTPYKDTDFIYIASFNSTPTCLILRAGAPFTTLREFQAYAKKNPKTVTVGIASDSHLLATVMLDLAASVETTTVSYKSGSEVLNAIMGGHIDAAMIAPQFGKIAAQEKLSVVGVTSDARIEVMPDVPTFKEQGLNIVMLMNRILVAPKKTPDAIIAVLRKACAVAAKDETLIKNVKQAGDEYLYLGGDTLGKYIEDMNKIYLPLVKNNTALFAR